MNAISPAHLTAAERLDELCAILAHGVVRLRARSATSVPTHHDVGRGTAPTAGRADAMDESFNNAAPAQPREVAFARMRRRAPHLVPLFEAVRDHEVGLLLVPQVTRPLFATLSTLRRPFIVILGDDTDRAVGPGHFHGPSIERLVGMVDVAAVMSGAPCNDVYADLSALAAWSRQNVLMVETRVEQEDAWIETIWQVAPELRMVICTVMAGRPCL